MKRQIPLVILVLLGWFGLTAGSAPYGPPISTNTTLRDAEPVGPDCVEPVLSSIAGIVGETPVRIWKQGVSGSYLGETRAGLINIRFDEPTCQGAVTSVEYRWLNPKYELRLAAPAGLVTQVALSQRKGFVSLSAMDRRGLVLTEQLSDLPTIVHMENGVVLMRYRRTICDPSHFAMIGNTPIEYVDAISDDISGPVLAQETIYAQWCWQQMPGEGS
jgi:hypothetical protein